MSIDPVDSPGRPSAGLLSVTWRWLTEPSASIKESEHRRIARLLSSLLVPLLPLSLLVFIIRAIIDPVFTPSPVAVGGLIILGSAYGLSRTRHYMWGAMLTLSAFPVSILTIAITNYNPADFKSLLAYLALGVLLGNMLLSARGTTILAVINLAALLILPVLIPEVTFLDIVSPLTFFVLMATSIALAGRYRDLVEIDRQAELSDSEERYRILFEYAPDAYYLNDMEGTFVEGNKAAEDLLGYRREELIGRNFLQLEMLPRSETLKALEALDQGMRGNPTGPDEFILNRKDGTQVEVEIRTYQVTIKGQRLVLGIARDITGRKQAEVALRESEERYRALVESSPSSISVMQKGRYVFTNPAGAKILGYTNPEDIVGVSALETISPDYIEKIQSRIARLEKGKPNPPIEIELLQADGSTVLIESTSVPISYQGEPATLIIGQDITKSRAAQVALRKSEEQLRSIINAIPLGMHMYRLEPDGRLVFTGANPAADTILGVDNAQFVGKTIEEAFPPLAETETPERYREVASTNKLWHTEQINYKDDRITGAFEVHAFQTSSGRMAAAFQDITKRKQTEAELLKYRHHLEDLVRERTADLEDANRRLQALARLKDEFVSNVSHELRTPLTNLKLYHRLLENSPHNAASYLETLNRETRRLEHTIESLLALSRIDQGELPLRVSAVDINALVNSYVGDRPLLAESKGLTLNFQQGPDLPPVTADEDLLGQVLGILMTNALNYTPSGGRIVIDTHLKEEDGKRWAGFRVSDTGPGIPLDEQTRLFERFFRGAVGRDSGAEGTGLGLAIAREIVDLHTGLIEVESAGIPGEGTRFWVWLPVD